MLIASAIIDKKPPWPGRRSRTPINGLETGEPEGTAADLSAICFHVFSQAFEIDIFA